MAEQSAPRNGTRELSDAQFRRKLLLAAFGVCAATALLFVDSLWRYAWNDFYKVIEWAGFALIIVCVLGRTWCTCYIGGKKNKVLIEHGPYSLVRNPLYVFSVIGAAGIGAQFGSLTIALLLPLVTTLVLRSVVQKEEVELAKRFGQSYGAYVARVPRFLPRLSLWQDLDELTLRHDLVAKTLLQASLFLLAIPFAEAVEKAQQLGWLPVVLRLA